MKKNKHIGFLTITRGAFSALRARIKKLKEENQITDEVQPYKPHRKETEKICVDISATSVAKAALVVIILYAATQFVVSINEILILFFVSLLFSSAIDPWINKLENKKIPRSISIILFYLFLLGIIWVMVVSLIPLIAGQMSELAARIQTMIGNLVKNESSSWPLLDSVKNSLKSVINDLDTQALISNASSSLSKFSESLGGVAGNVWEAMKMLFNGIFNFILVLFLTYFMAVDSRGIEQFIKSLFPSKHGKYIAAKAGAIREKIGHWLRGQLLLMLSVGILSFIGLSLIGMQYAATLALVAGVTEIIPVAGPILAFAFSLPIAANQSLWMVGALIIVFVIVQQFENNILVPVIMKKSVGLSPIVIMFAMLVGYHFLSILGIILSVPVASTVNIFLTDYLEKEK